MFITLRKTIETENTTFIKLGMLIMTRLIFVVSVGRGAN